MIAFHTIFSQRNTDHVYTLQFQTIQGFVTIKINIYIEIFENCKFRRAFRALLRFSKEYYARMFGADNIGKNNQKKGLYAL